MELRASLVPDEKEMEKATEQAEQYLQTKYPEMKYQISDISYNSEQKSGNYDYAAMVWIQRHKNRLWFMKTEFLEKWKMIYQFRKKKNSLNK